MPKWNNEMLQHMSQEQAETVARDLSAMFQSHSEIEVNCRETATPNTQERTFTIWHSVCLWYDGMLVCSFDHPNDLDRFLAVARLLSENVHLITEAEQNILKSVFPEKYGH